MGAMNVDTSSVRLRLFWDFRWSCHNVKDNQMIIINDLQNILLLLLFIYCGMSNEFTIIANKESVKLVMLKPFWISKQVSMKCSMKLSFLVILFSNFIFEKCPYKTSSYNVFSHVKSRCIYIKSDTTRRTRNGHFLLF